MEAASARRRAPAGPPPPCARARPPAIDLSLNLYAALALIYLLLPIAVIIVFSFNDPQGKFNFTWHGLHAREWSHPFDVHGADGGDDQLAQDRGDRDGRGDRARHHDGLALVRYQFRGRAPTNLFIFLPLATPEVVVGASLLSFFLSRGGDGFATIVIAHIMFCISFVVVTVGPA